MILDVASRRSSPPVFFWLLAVTLLAANAKSEVLIGIGEIWKYRPADIPPHPAWNEAAFDDREWSSGPSGFSVGYGTYNEATVIPSVPGNFPSVYFRKPFFLEDPDSLVWPMLRVDFNDGFVAYLNGVEVARSGLTGDPPYFDQASVPRSRGNGLEIPLENHLGVFREGTNVLAFQVHNASLTNATLALIPELLSGITRGPIIANTSSNQTRISWKTPAPASSIIHYGTTRQLNDQSASEILVTNHVMRLSGLQPDTRYFYRVESSDGSSTTTSSLSSFKTLKTAGSVSFQVLGDSGVGQTSHYRIAEMLRRRPADLVLHAGDAVYPQFTMGRVDAKLFSVHRAQMASIPWFYCIGNHDLYSGDSHYLESLHLPTNSVTGTEHFYSFDHGDVHFVSLMVPYLSQYRLEVGNDQYRWLTNDLASTTRPWKVLLFHVPFQTSSVHRDDDKDQNGIQDRLEIRDVLLPIAKEHGVQIMFSGHDHLFESFAPTNGVHTITTGGGGVGLYGLQELDAASVHAAVRFHACEVTVDGTCMEVKAIDPKGKVFDRVLIHRDGPVTNEFRSTWNSPVIEGSGQATVDGNIEGQQFDFPGKAIPTKPGQFSNLGEFHVNHDADHLYLGFSHLMLRADSIVYLFLESPHLMGASNLLQTGNGLIDPEQQGADGLDMLSNLQFESFSPSIGIILGDEMADATMPSFRRSPNALDTGQGAFWLNETLDPVADVRIQQYDRTPQFGAIGYEQTANFIEISIPRSTLGNLSEQDWIRVAAVVAGNGINAAEQSQRLDDAFLGAALQSENGTHRLSPVTIHLGPNPDRDGDGLPNQWEELHGLNPDSTSGDDGGMGDPDGDGADNVHEFRAGTDPNQASSLLDATIQRTGVAELEITWNANPGFRYVLEQSPTDQNDFHSVNVMEFPRTATTSLESSRVPVQNRDVRGMIYRVRRVD